MSHPMPAATTYGNVAGISTATPVMTPEAASACATCGTVLSRATIRLPTRIPIIQQACIAPSRNSSPCSTNRTCRMPASALGRCSCSPEGLRSDRTNASNAA